MNLLFYLTEMQRLLCNVESVWSTAMRVVERQFLSHGCLSLSKPIKGIHICLFIWELERDLDVEQCDKYKRSHWL